MTKARTLADNFAADINGITAGTGITGGGTSGTVTITNEMATTITAKGDLLAGTGNAAFDNLAAGASGETLVADSSTTTGLAYREDYAAGKNKIINGDFRINQRAFTTTTTNAAYGQDRWQIAATDGTTTYTPETFTLGAAPVAGYEAQNYARLVTTGQTAVGALSMLIQPIEDVRTFANETVTVSFWAQAGSGTPDIAVELKQNFGTGGSPSADVNTYLGKVTLSTSWTRYSLTVANPSISGKTIGTAANSSYLRLGLFVSAGSNFNSRTGSLGIQSNTFNIWGVQVEAGSVATAFQTSTGTLAGELAACQRYYLKSYNQATAPGTASNTVGNTGYSAISATSTNNRWNVRFPVNMRTTPTITVYSTSSGTSAKIYNEQAAVDVDAATQYIGESGFHLYTSSGTPTAGHQLLAHYVASAEL